MDKTQGLKRLAKDIAEAEVLYDTYYRHYDMQLVIAMICTIDEHVLMGDFTPHRLALEMRKEAIFETALAELKGVK